MRRLQVLDVFGDGGPTGNPVAVVHDAEGLGDAEMQRFANWTNLSETTFLLAASEPGADYRVRIFTTSAELPFAGHPTLGSAHAWLSAQRAPEGERIVQQCAGGLVALRRIEGRLAFAAPPRTRSGPLDAGTLAAIRDAFGLRAEEIVDHAWTVNGPEWATVRLADRARLLTLTPVPGAPRDVGFVAIGEDGTPELRAFIAGDGPAFEDPVTGSLNAAVAQWLTERGTLRAPWIARQGTALGRRGRVHVTEDDAGALWIGGETRIVVEGTVAL